MEDRKQQLVFAWLAKAKNDLEAARLLIVDEKRLLDIGVYHCQQAAEKALKAWLTSRDIVFPKTRSLEDLLRLCVPSASAFSQFQHHAEELTPLAIAYRYPGDASVPDMKLASRALVLAEEICNFCEQQLGLKKE